MWADTVLSKHMRFQDGHTDGQSLNKLRDGARRANIEILKTDDGDIRPHALLILEIFGQKASEVLLRRYFALSSIFLTKAPSTKHGFSVVIRKLSRLVCFARKI